MTNAPVGRKPTRAPDVPYKDGDDPLHMQGGWIWAPLRLAWRKATPEEHVRQLFIYRLHKKWGYSLDQMSQERRTQSGRSSSRADIVVAKDAQALRDNRDYIIVVEVKSDNVSIDVRDYAQGESYARAVGAEFLVCQNNKEHSFFRLTPGAPGQRIQIVEIPSAADILVPTRLESVRRATKTFTRDEFQRLLHECHSILRDNHKMEPGAAFDDISRILFIKMAYERMGKAEVFTTDKIKEVARANLLDVEDPGVLNQLFEVTKRKFEADNLFPEDDRIRVTYPTFVRIVRMLERFNLSDTGDDIKGLAFERFLGDTFRGELGQFFTPRPIVEFMVAALNPQEGERICDPACGTGGFLIKTFEHIKDDIEKSIIEQKEAAKRELTEKAAKAGWTEDKLDEAISDAVSKINAELDTSSPDSRLGKVSRNSIFGVDAEARAARTAKMNMIMHGDGHGGIYYHDGLLDTGGVFPGQFDIVLTNPPFGATVGDDQLVGTTEQAQVNVDRSYIKKYSEKYGDRWSLAHGRMVEAAKSRRPILELFDIGRSPIAAPMGQAKVRRSRATEEVFVERCISLLKPGGRMGIVLPDGILNNPSTEWLREYVEGRAKLSSVISIPHEVFRSANATVKTSLVFLRRFTDHEVREWSDLTKRIDIDVRTELQSLIDELRSDRALAEVGGDTTLLPLLNEILDAGVGSAKEKKLRLQLSRALGPAGKAKARAMLRDVKGREDALEMRIDSEVRLRRKKEWDYPVLMAEVSAAGITGSGETGPHVPNELPEVLDSIRDFEKDPAGSIERQESEFFQ